MKKILVLPALLLIISTAFYSCKSGEAYTIKMKLKQGDHFDEKLKMNMNMSYSVMNMKMSMETGYGFDVTKETPDEKQVKLTYSNMHMKMDMGDLGKSLGGMNTDSMLNEKTKEIAGKTITLVLSKDNEVKDVIGADAFMNDSTMSDETKKMLEGLVNKDQMKSMWGMMFGMYPSDAVHVGDTWKREVSMNFNGLTMTVKAKYTLQGVKDGIAEIKMDGVIDSKGKMDKVPVEMKMSGTQKGSMFIKLADGYPDHGDFKMDVKADMEMMGQKMPMKMDGDYSITTK